MQHFRRGTFNFGTHSTRLWSGKGRKETSSLTVPSFSARSFVETSVTGTRRRFSRTRHLTSTRAAFPGTCNGARQVAGNNCAFDIPSLPRATERNFTPKFARKGDVGRQSAAWDMVSATCLPTLRSMLRGTLLLPPETPPPYPLIPLTVGLRWKRQQSIFHKAFRHSDQLVVDNREFLPTDECVFRPGAVCTTSAERGLVFFKEPASNQLNSSGNWTLEDQVGQWLQVNLSHITNITAIETRGHSQGDRRTTQYLLYSSCDGEYWKPHEKVKWNMS